MPESITVWDCDARRIDVRASDGVGLTGTYWPSLRDPSSGATPLAYVVGHGFTGSSLSPAVQGICERLAGRGAAVVALDFRGHGGSGGLSSVGVAEELDVGAAVDFLRTQGYRRICVAGWSMGASVAVRYGARHGHGGANRQAEDRQAEDRQAEDGRAGSGDLAAVVSISGPGLWYERGTRSMRRLHLATETRLGRLILASGVLGGGLLNRGRRTRVGVDGWDELPESPVELAGRVGPIPFLIVHGDRDPYFPLWHARALAAAAPSSSLWIEEGMGHAEKSTSPELLDRIDAWVRRATMAR